MSLQEELRGAVAAMREATGKLPSTGSGEARQKIDPAAIKPQTVALGVWLALCEEDHKVAVPDSLRQHFEVGSKGEREATSKAVRSLLCPAMGDGAADWITWVADYTPREASDEWILARRSVPSARAKDTSGAKVDPSKLASPLTDERLDGMFAIAAKLPDALQADLRAAIQATQNADAVAVTADEVEAGEGEESDAGDSLTL